MRTRAVALALACAALAAGCGSSSSPSATKTATPPPTKGTITVGAFNFAESQILASMFAQVLDKAGYNASVKPLTNREVVEPALWAGQIGALPEYVGTLTEFINKKDNGPNAKPLASGDLDKTLAELRKLAAKHHIAVYTPAQAADENAFAVPEKFATANHLTTLSDLAGYKGKLVLGGPPECPKRPFCQVGLEKVYGIKFSGFKALDAGGPLTKQALKAGLVQLGLVFSSDPGISTFSLKVLTDDKHLQTVDNVVPVVNTKWNKPDVQQALDGVMKQLTTAELVALNKQVDVEHQDPEQVAKSWLMSKNLI